MNRKAKPSVKIYIDNILIEQVAKTKFLGTIITEYLTILKLFAIKLAKVLD